MRSEIAREVHQRTVAPSLWRFPEPVRPAIVACAAQHPRLAQLAETFPLLLHALATGAAEGRLRDRVIARAIAGERLPALARLVGLPLAFRRLVPEALGDRVTPVRWTPEAGLRLAPHIPDEAALQTRWIGAVSLAARFGGEAFALWVARHAEFHAIPGLDPDSLRPLAIYCWHAAEDHDGGERALAALARRRWTGDLSVEATVLDARLWFNRLKLLVYFRDSGVPKPHLPGATVNGFEIHPLLDPDEIIREAKIMSNCIDSYADRLARGTSRLFSVRRAGCHLATFEVCPGRGRPGRLRLGQIRGPGNCGVGHDTATAIGAWWRSRPVSRAPHSGPPRSPRSDERRLHQLLRPYLTAFDLELNPAATTNSVREIDRDIADLATALAIRNWMFS